MFVDTVLKEKYNLGGINLYPDTSTIRDDLSTRELNEIYDFFEKNT